MKPEKSFSRTGCTAKSEFCSKGCNCCLKLYRSHSRAQEGQSTLLLHVHATYVIVENISIATCSKTQWKGELLLQCSSLVGSLPCSSLGLTVGLLCLSLGVVPGPLGLTCKASGFSTPKAGKICLRTTERYLPLASPIALLASGSF